MSLPFPKGLSYTQTALALNSTRARWFPVTLTPSTEPRLTPSRTPHVGVAPRLVLLAIVLVAFGVRVYHLDWQPLWWDEGFSIATTVGGIAERIRIAREDTYQPLSYLPLALMALSGQTPFEMRFPSVVYGTLMVPLLGLLGWRITGQGPGLLAASLLALAPFAIYHGQEVRMYGLTPLIALLAWHSLIRGVDRYQDATNDRGRLGPFQWHYPVTVALAWSTHYYLVLLPLVHGVYLLMQPMGRRLLKPWTRCLAVAALGTLPWLAAIAPSLYVESVFQSQSDPWRSIGVLPYLQRYLRITYIGYDASASGLQVAAMAFLAAGVAVGLILHWRDQEPRRQALGLLASSAAAVTAVYGIQFLHPSPEFSRRLAWTFPPVLLGISICLWQLRTRQPLLFAVAGLPFLASWALVWPARYNAVLRTGDLSYRQMAATLASVSQPADLLVSEFPWQHGLLASYLPQPRPDLALLPAGRSFRPASVRLDYLKEAMQGRRRIWYPAYQALGGTAGQGAHAYLASNAYLAFDAPFGTTRLLLFDTRTNFTKAPSLPLASPMGPDIQLLGFSLPPTDAATPKLSYHSHEIIPLALFWQTRAPLDISYTAFVHLVDAAGQPVLFADDEPDHGQHPTTSWSPGETIADLHSIHLPSTLPPGPYRIYVGLYDSLTGRRLPVDPPHPEGRFLTTVQLGPEPWK